MNSWIDPANICRLGFRITSLCVTENEQKKKKKTWWKLKIMQKPNLKNDNDECKPPMHMIEEIKHCRLDSTRLDSTRLNKIEIQCVKRTRSETWLIPRICIMYIVPSGIRLLSTFQFLQVDCGEWASFTLLLRIYACLRFGYGCSTYTYIQ